MHTLFVGDEPLRLVKVALVDHNDNRDDGQVLSMLDARGEGLFMLLARQREEHLRPMNATLTVSKLKRWLTAQTSRNASQSLMCVSHSSEYSSFPGVRLLARDLIKRCAMFKIQSR